jgi:hypothetical protein
MLIGKCGNNRMNCLKNKVCQKKRPERPERDPAYPTKAQIMLTLLEQFKFAYPEIRVRLVACDALYGTGDFLDSTLAIFGGVQVVSQLRSNQKVLFGKKLVSVKQYFPAGRGQVVELKIRGGETLKATVDSARLYVDAHEKKRSVIAIKYEGEQESRYLVASDMSW